MLNHPEGNPSADILAAVLKGLKPKSNFLVLNVNNVDEVKTALLFSGFVNVSQLEDCGLYFYILNIFDIY